ncbi:MAG: hypothetical protein A2X18_13635 [Bacteroidetes bacterium GWF2_40_14]|nr:MAG: hypothetical protein A2X18_13635 [Bacteroidetes bacterium GWF2_40_14]
MNYNYARQLAEIIVKIWLNKASENERERLLSWLDENEENRQTYKNIINGESLLKRLRKEDKISETTDFELLCKEIAQKLLKRKARERALKVMSYAAGCIILAVGGLLWMTGDNSKEELLSDSVSKVRLVMSTGDVINLDTQVPDSINTKSALILKDTLGLIYKAKDELLEGSHVVEKNKIITEVGGEYSFTLSDGTKVWLNSLSEIEFPVNFTGNERIVNLTGEAYFEVTPDAKRPFIVHSLNQSVQVLGTTFNIKAYPDEDMVYTTLVEGKITVGSGGRKVVLSPGMESVCQRSKNGIETHSVNTDFNTAWRTGFFMFNNQDLGEMLKVLERWYGYDFKYSDSDTGANTFSGRFNKYSDLVTILSSITLAGGPEFIMNDKDKSISIKNRTN